MTPRFYANPFVRDAAPAHVVKKLPWRYVGPLYTSDGTYKSFTRTVVYSDGARLSEDKFVDVHAALWGPYLTRAESMTP